MVAGRVHGQQEHLIVKGFLSNTLSVIYRFGKGVLTRFYTYPPLRSAIAPRAMAAIAWSVALGS
jgi:hypothetical protein